MLLLLVVVVVLVLVVVDVGCHLVFFVLLALLEKGPWFVFFVTTRENQPQQQ